MYRPAASRFALILALAAAPQLQLSAQQTAVAATKPLTLADYGRWNRITSAGLSSDGKWMAYVFTPNDGTATLYIKQLEGDKLYTLPGGSGAVFSDNAKWVGYYVSPPDRTGADRAGGGAAGRGGRGGAPAVPAVPPAGRGGAPGAAAADPATVRRFELLNLTDGAKMPVPNAESFKFSKGSRWLAVRLNKTSTDAKVRGADLYVRTLDGGDTRNIGNVYQYEFDAAGRWLAYTVDATDKLGNGVYVLDPRSNESRGLQTGMHDYDQLVWSDSGTGLAVFSGDKKTGWKQRDNTLVAWTAAGSPGSQQINFSAASDPSFPKGFVVSEYTAPRWSHDGSRIFFGIKEQVEEISKADSSLANVDVWHWKDAEIQSVQIVRLAQERRQTFPAALMVDTKKFSRLGDDDMRQVQNTANGKWAIGSFDAPYRGEVQWSGSKADVYRINTANGERQLIAKGLTRTMGTSPDSRWFLYLKDKHVAAFNLETGKSVDVDAAAGRSFVNTEDDHPYELPVWGVAGWAKDGNSVLMYDKYDVWQVSLNGGKAVNLTAGTGRAQQIQFRVVRLEGAGGGRGGRGGGGGARASEDDGIDLSKPLLLSAYGEWTKKSGYWQVTAGSAPAPLAWADKQIGQAVKAENSDRVIFTQQSFTEFPDYWATNTSFAAPRKVTDANPFITEYAWGTRVLVDFKNKKGQRLQGTLTLPANYQPGKKYPMIVYFYEIMSNTQHTFSQPVYDDRPHMSTYASNGYLVFSPDIVYETGKPGSSALDCVTSGVKKVIELGYADPKHIGLQGHSWGGYETSYILTQTDMFATVVTGAPPADLVAMYDQLYKQSGTANNGIFEVGQVRMGEGNTPWTARELYESQSPVHNVRNIKTPFLILQGTDDGAVDWLQGVEWYNAAKRWGKEVIFLSYPGEPHHLAKKENQKDFQIRMKQYFDHYLMDAPAPKWMTEGVPQTQKGGPIR